MTHEEVFQRAEAAGVDGAYSLVSEDHPVGLYLGLERGNRALMVVCPRQPPPPPPLAAISVESRQRLDGDWALVLRLERTDLKSLFAHLVEDLEGATRIEGGDPGDTVVRRLVRWQRLLSRRASMVLEEHELRGLAAELTFLADEAVPALGSAAGVNGWVGPYAAPKDFVFAMAEVEVKAVRRLQRTVTVSSLEQLTEAELPLFIWICEVESTEEQDRNGVAFPTLVARVRSLVASDACASERLEESLRSAGYEDRPEYGQVFVRVGRASTYHVGSSFPRLTRGGVSAGIVGCRYELLIRALEPFIVPTWREALVRGNEGA
jgi:hypothetical protein